jgi:hypothetical protein
MVNAVNLQNDLNVLSSSSFENGDFIFTDLDKDRVKNAVISTYFVPNGFFRGNKYSSDEDFGSEFANDGEFDYRTAFKLISGGGIRINRNKSGKEIFKENNWTLVQEYEIHDSIVVNEDRVRGSKAFNLKPLFENDEDYEQIIHNRIATDGCFVEENVYIDDRVIYTHLHKNLSQPSNGHADEVYFNRFKVLLEDLRADIEIIITRGLNISNANVNTKTVLKNRGILIDEILSDIFLSLDFRQLKKMEVQDVDYMSSKEVSSRAFEMSDLIKMDDEERFLMEIIDKIYKKKIYNEVNKFSGEESRELGDSGVEEDLGESDAEEDLDLELENIEDFLKSMDNIMPGHKVINHNGEKKKVTKETIIDEFERNNSQYFFSILFELQKRARGENNVEENTNSKNPFIDLDNSLDNPFDNFSQIDQFMNEFEKKLIDKVEKSNIEFFDDLVLILNNEIDKLKYENDNDGIYETKPSLSKELIIGILREMMQRNNESISQYQERLIEILEKCEYYFLKMLDNFAIADSEYGTRRSNIGYNINNQIFSILILYIKKKMEQNDSLSKRELEIKTPRNYFDEGFQKLESIFNTLKSSPDGVKAFDNISMENARNLKSVLKEIVKILNAESAEVKEAKARITICESRIAECKSFLKEKYAKYCQVYKEKSKLYFIALKKAMKSKVGWYRGCEKDVRRQRVMEEELKNLMFDIEEMRYISRKLSIEVGVLKRAIDDCENETKLCRDVLEKIVDLISTFALGLNRSAKFRTFKDFDEKVICEIKENLPMIQYCLSRIWCNEINFKFQKFTLVHEDLTVKTEKKFSCYANMLLHDGETHKVNHKAIVEIKHDSFRIKHGCVFFPCNLYVMVVNVLFQHNVITSEQHYEMLSSNREIRRNVLENTLRSNQSQSIPDEFSLVSTIPSIRSIRSAKNL